MQNCLAAIDTITEDVEQGMLVTGPLTLGLDRSVIGRSKADRAVCTMMHGMAWAGCGEMTHAYCCLKVVYIVGARQVGWCCLLGDFYVPVAWM